MRSPLLQHFFTMAAVGVVAGCAASQVDARSTPVVDVDAAKPSASGAAPKPRPRAVCLPSELIERGTIDAVAVDTAGALSLCLAYEGGRACVEVSRAGGLRWPDVDPPRRVPVPLGADEEPLRRVGRRTAMRACVAVDVCTLSLVDLDGAAPTVHVRGLFAQSPAIVADVAGDRFAFLDAAGSLRFVAADSGQEDGDLHVPDATAGAALVSLAPGEAAIVLPAPRAGTVVRVDVRRVELGLAIVPPTCP